MTGKPGMAALWYQAGEDPERYREFLHQHGYTVRPGEPGYEEASRTLPCGWEPGKTRAEQDRCEITDLLRASCPHCAGRGEEIPPEEHDKANLGYAFTARYAAPCAWCGERFPEGETIRSDRVSGGYVCSECAR